MDGSTLRGYDAPMDTEQIARLRRDQMLSTLDDGSEAASLAVQFPGDLPRLDRAARREWLHSHFSQLGEALPANALEMRPETLSISGQSIEARCAVRELPKVKQLLESSGHRVSITRKLQAVPASSSTGD